MDKFRNGVAMLVVRGYKGKVALSIESPEWAAATPTSSNATIQRSPQCPCPDPAGPDAASLMRYSPGDTELGSLEETHTGPLRGVGGENADY